MLDARNYYDAKQIEYSKIIIANFCLLSLAIALEFLQGIRNYNIKKYGTKLQHFSPAIILNTLLFISTTNKNGFCFVIVANCILDNTANNKIC